MGSNAFSTCFEEICPFKKESKVFNLQWVVTHFLLTSILLIQPSNYSSIQRERGRTKARGRERNVKIFLKCIVVLEGSLFPHRAERGLSERFVSQSSKAKGRSLEGHGGRLAAFFFCFCSTCCWWRGSGFAAGVSSQPTSPVQSHPHTSFFTLMLAGPRGAGSTNVRAAEQRVALKTTKQKQKQNKNKNPVPGLCLEYMFMFIQKGAFLKELPPRAVTSLQKKNKNKTKTHTEISVLILCFSRT